jgi:hypothetical protein
MLHPHPDLAAVDRVAHAVPLLVARDVPAFPLNLMSERTCVDG